ncbi:MAG: DNA methyltransferase, partial [Bdellovibrionales bacterium]
MIYDDFIELPFVYEREAPPQDDASDRYPESLVRYFLDTYTKKGDRVFDPFTGLGTTAFVAEELGRVPYGIEADRKRFEWVAGQLEHWQNIKYGDAGDIAQMR